MTKRFREALIIFEKLYEDKIWDIKILAKLIICHAVSGDIKKAILLLNKALEKDFNFFVFKNFETKICPCEELISKIERKEITFNSKHNKSLALGVLWLYCDIEQSLFWFSEAYSKKNDSDVYKIISTISVLIQKSNQLWS